MRKHKSFFQINLIIFCLYILFDILMKGQKNYLKFMF